MMSAITHIGIGSNMGDRRANCLKAVDLLRERGLVIRKVSSLYETEPWGLTDQPLFINAALEAETGLSPIDLLALLKATEEAMGRVETVKWGPRLIDLDLLFYEDTIISGAGLEIPHPLLSRRDFVLTPLTEIAPDKQDPLTGKTVMQMKEELREHEDAERQEQGQDRVH